jgi:hypothetical protein
MSPPGYDTMMMAIKKGKGKSIRAAAREGLVVRTDLPGPPPQQDREYNGARLVKHVAASR